MIPYFSLVKLNNLFLFFVLVTLSEQPAFFMLNEIIGEQHDLNLSIKESFDFDNASFDAFHREIKIGSKHTPYN